MKKIFTASVLFLGLSSIALNAMPPIPKPPIEPPAAMPPIPKPPIEPPAAMPYLFIN